MVHFTDQLIPSKTAIIVSNMINGFIDPAGPAYMEQGREISKDLGAFLDECRNLGFLIIYTYNGYRADGLDLPKNIRRCEWNHNGTAFIEGTWDCEPYPTCIPAPKDVVLRKLHYDAFFGTDLAVMLETAEIDTVVLAGVSTDVSCFFTARGAFNLNYKVLLLYDLTATVSRPDFGYGSVTTEEQHIIAVNNLASTGAQIITGQEFFRMQSASEQR